MWSFFPTQSLILTRAINANPEAVIAILHNPQVFLKLGPYVSEVVLVAEDAPDSPQKFTITDSIPIISSFKVKITYKVSIKIHADGFLGSSVAGIGTKTRSNFSAKAGKDDNTTEVTQNSIVTVSHISLSKLMYFFGRFLYT
jgi:hypothetical protein